MRFSLLPVEGKSVSGLPGVPQRGAKSSPKVARELPSQKHLNFVLDLLLKQRRFEQGRNYKKRGGSYRPRAITRDTPKRTLFLDRHTGKAFFEDLACACDGLFPLPVKENATQKALGVFSGSACDCLFPLPVEEKTISGSPGRPWEPSEGVFAMAFSPCLSRKRQYHGLGVRLRWVFPPPCRGKGPLMD